MEVTNRIKVNFNTCIYKYYSVGSSNTVVTHTSTCSQSTSSTSSQSTLTLENDIGKLVQSHVDLHQLSRENKHCVLTTEPDSDPSSLPRTRSSDSVPYQQFQPSWLKQYPWLHYSRHDNGVYCRACALFAPKKVGGQDLGQFVTKPFKSWGKILQKASVHGMKNYHLSSMARMTEFLARYENPSQSISVIMDTELQRLMETNQKVLESLIKLVLLCGKQGLALRGHRDDKISWTEDDAHSNEGNFVELVRFRAETDPVLAQHLAKSPRNARYTSKTIQN